MIAVGARLVSLGQIRHRPYTTPAHRSNPVSTTSTPSPVGDFRRVATANSNLAASVSRNCIHATTKNAAENAAMKSKLMVISFSTILQQASLMHDGTPSELRTIRLGSGQSR
jgi:hypothetical protein